MVQTRTTDYAVLVLAGFLYAVALKYFVLPARVILTGTEGIASALSYYFEKDWLFLVLYAVFQSCVLAFGYFRVSKRFAIRSATVVAMVLCAIPLLPSLQFAQPESQNERIILVLFGGILAGVAKVIAFRRRGSTADEDIFGAYFAMKYLKPVGFVAVIAGAISTTFGLALDLIKTGQFEIAVNTLMYTSIYIFVSAETINNFYHKFRISLVTVITKNVAAIKEAISETTAHRTYTIEDGVGGYSNEPTKVIRTVITYEELPDVLRAIKRRDPSAFMFHHDIEGISGKYFIEPIG